MLADLTDASTPLVALIDDGHFCGLVQFPVAAAGGRVGGVCCVTLHRILVCGRAP